MPFRARFERDVRSMGHSDGIKTDCGETIPVWSLDRDPRMSRTVLGGHCDFEHARLSGFQAEAGKSSLSISY